MELIRDGQQGFDIGLSGLVSQGLHSSLQGLETKALVLRVMPTTGDGGLGTKVDLRQSVCRTYCIAGLELLDVAKQVRAIPSFSLLMIDTENKFVSTGLAKEIADTAGGNYHKLPKMTQEAIAGVASGAIADMRNA